MHVSLSYHGLSDNPLDTFGIGVKDRLLENAILFPNRPVSDASLGSLVSTHSSTYVAYKMGGVNQQPAYNTAYTALITGLDSIADYINGIVKNNQATAEVVIV